MSRICWLGRGYVFHILCRGSGRRIAVPILLVPRQTARVECTWVVRIFFGNPSWPNWHLQVGKRTQAFSGSPLSGYDDIINGTYRAGHGRSRLLNPCSGGGSWRKIKLKWLLRRSQSRASRAKADSARFPDIPRKRRDCRDETGKRESERQARWHVAPSTVRLHRESRRFEPVAAHQSANEKGRRSDPAALCPVRRAGF